MSFLWQTLLRIALGVLGELVAAYIRNLQAARLDDSSLIAAVDMAVRNAASQADLSNTAKMDQGINVLKAWASALGRDMSESLARTSIELGVQRMKEKS